MTYDDVVKHYGSVKAAASAIGVIPAAVYAWKGRGIPVTRQYQIEVITKSKLRADRLVA